MSFIYMNGGAVLDAWQPVVNSPETVEAIQFYNDLVYKYKVLPPPKIMPTLARIARILSLRKESCHEHDGFLGNRRVERGDL